MLDDSNIVLHYSQLNPKRFLVLPGYGLPFRRTLCDGKCGAGFGWKGFNDCATFCIGTVLVHPRWRIKSSVAAM
eukprot:m.293424 g.293424  ORF g.293424 m.293424 type:complete len:74 (+) comp20018_c0_seq1:20-241(+)